MSESILSKNIAKSPHEIGTKLLNSGPFKVAGIDTIIKPLKLTRDAPSVLKSLFLLSKLIATKGNAARKAVVDELVILLVKNERNTLLRPKSFGFNSYEEMSEYIVQYFEKTKFRQKSTREFLRIKRRLGNFRRLKGKLFERMLIHSKAFQDLTQETAEYFVHTVLKNKELMDRLITAKGESLKDLLPKAVKSLDDEKLLNANGVTLGDPTMYHSVRVKFKKPVTYNGMTFTHAESTDVLHLTEIGLPGGRKIKAVSLETEIKTEGAVNKLPAQLSSGESRYTHDNVEHIEMTDLNGNTVIVKPEDLLLYRSEELLGKSPFKYGFAPYTFEQWNNEIDAATKRKISSSLFKDASIGSAIKSMDFEPVATNQRSGVVIIKGTVSIAPHHLETFISPIFSGEM